jgi:hypothetical protein
MTKLTAYKTSVSELETITATIKSLESQIEEIGTLTVSSSVTIKQGASDAQYIFGIGILNSQILACKELGLNSTDKEDMKKSCMNLRTLTKELNDWLVFEDEIIDYKNNVFRLLTEKEKFSLLKYPKKK